MPDTSPPSVPHLPLPSSVMSTTGVEILDLTQQNWSIWNATIEQCLQLCGLDDYLDGSIKKPGDDQPIAQRNWLMNDKAVRALLKLRSSRDDQEAMKSCTSAKEAWAALTKRHEKQGVYAQVLLFNQLLNCRFTKSERLATTISRIRETVRRIFAIGIPDENALLTVALMNSLSGDFDHVQSQVGTLVAQSSTTNPYGATQIIQRLDLEQQLLDNSNPLSATALLAKGPIKKICANCKRTGHSADSCWQAGGGAEGKRDEILAKKAKATRSVPNTRSNTPTLGQIRRDSAGRAFIVDASTNQAFYLASDTGSPSPTATEFATLAIDSGGPEDLDPIALSASESELCEISTIDWRQHSKDGVDPAAYIIAPRSHPRASTLSSSDLFYFDSGASKSISPCRDDFTSLTPLSNCRIGGIGGSSIAAVGLGTVDIELANGKHLTLDNVLYAPQAAVRLVSISAICSSGNKPFVRFDDTSALVYARDGTELASGTLVQKQLYALDGVPVQAHDHALLAAPLPDLQSWHLRLGHVNHDYVYDMACGGTVEGMTVDLSSAPPKCSSCILGKQTKTPVPKSREGEKATRRLELVYADLMGPADTMSATGNLYSLNIIDDCTSLSWTIPLPNKQVAFDRYRAWHLAREVETGEKIGCVQIDSGELKSSSMETFLNSRGTRLRFTAPYTSAHNGRVERLHRTLMNKARSMRSYANVPSNRWDEFLLTANYLHIRTPTRSLPCNVTPFEAYHNRKPDLSHLREIGCRAFVLIQNKHNPKIYERSIECVLIGYGPDSKTYRCYHRATRKLVQSYHVAFIESFEEGARPLHPGVILQQSLSNRETAQPLLDDPLPLVDMPTERPAEDTHARAPSANAEASESLPQSMPQLPPPPPPAVPPQPALRRSTRATVPSDKCAAATGVSKLSAVDRAIAEARESAVRVHEQRQQRRGASAAVEEAIEEGMAAMADPTVLDCAIEPDPETMKEALAGPNGEHWRASALEEFASLKELNVYKLVRRSEVPANRKVMHGKPVFRLKQNEAGKPIRFKTRWVLKGYEAIFGVDYNRTTSPTMRMESFRIIAHIAASLDWALEQIDIKTAFLYGLLPADEVCYMEQPEGFEEEGHPREEWVWELQKGLYGMKQGGRVWNQTMNTRLEALGFTRIPCEYCIYVRKRDSGTIITGVHVDDFALTASNDAEANRFKDELREQWQINDLGPAKFCLGIHIERDRATRTVMLSQTALIDKVVAEFRLTDAHPTATPMEEGLKLSRDVSLADLEAGRNLPYRRLVGSLMYLAIGTRPDISFAVQQLSQFLSSYGPAHWEAAKRVVRYLKGTRDLKLHLGGSQTARLVGFTDASYASCPDTRRSTSGYCFSLGSGLVSWSSRKQKTVSDSTSVAEYVAASEAAKESIWLRELLRSIGYPQQSPSPLLCDNSAAIVNSGDPFFHFKMKHVDVRYHLIREYVNSNQIHVSYVNTKDNVADTFTKALGPKPFERLRRFMGLA